VSHKTQPGIEIVRLSYGLLANDAQFPALVRLSHGMLWRQRVWLDTYATAANSLAANASHTQRRITLAVASSSLAANSLDLALVKLNLGTFTAANSAGASATASASAIGADVGGFTTAAHTEPRIYLTMSTTLEIAEGATLPILTGIISDANGPFDLSGGTVEFLYSLNGAATVTRTATLVDGPTGSVSYAWVAGDTAEPGTLMCQWVVTIGSDVLRAPSSGPFKLKITAGLP